jgi:hypothetical protein
MVKHNVRVVIRTRPTANFASKNLQIDPLTNVSDNYSDIWH